MSQEQKEKQEARPSETVFVLLAIGMVAGLAMGIAGIVVIFKHQIFEIINFFQIVGGLIVAVVSAFTFGRLLSGWHGKNYFEVVKDMLMLRDPRKHSLKEEDE
ncbi:hypothetical protein MYX07_05400 [Patescibacteria group bacterium AH-259-L07]|nr:hypothetical protein [Patescibacteria group bacterium AH-259-L07]